MVSKHHHLWSAMGAKKKHLLYNVYPYQYCQLITEAVNYGSCMRDTLLDSDYTMSLIHYRS